MEPYKPNKPWISVNLPSREELIAMAMGLIPGGRALKNMYDNPEGPFTETLDLAAEDIIPLYGSLIKPAIKGEDIDAEQALKEAAIFGIPMPYTKFPKGHPKAGEAIPNNVMEGLGDRAWADAKSRWKNNKPQARKLYADPNDMFGNRKGRISTRSRVNATADAREAIDVPAGPYRETNTGSDIVNQGQQANRTNAVSVGLSNAKSYTGELGWQGDMYPPGRSLARLDEYGPYVWDKATDQAEYIRKLNDIINENEYKWEYLINKTRTKPQEGGRAPKRSTVVPKEDIVSVALAQGRPDIAARVMADNEPRKIYMEGNPGYDRRFRSYKAQQTVLKDDAKWKDLGNRQVEKELREQFAMLPEDPIIREKFAEYYGVPDLYNDWVANPEYWKEFRDKTASKRYHRELSNKAKDRLYQRDIER